MCVIVMTIAILLRNVLEDNTPVAFNIDGSTNFGIPYIGWTQVTLRSNPVGGVIWGWSFGSTGVVGVVKCGFLWGGNVLNKIVSRLIRDIRILLQKDWILADFVGDLIFRILWILNTEWKIRVKSTLWRGLGVTISMWRMWMMRGWVDWMDRVVGCGGECQSDRNHHSDDLNV